MAKLSVAITVTAAGTPLTMGVTQKLPEADNGNGNLLVAQPAILSAPGKLQDLSFYVTLASGVLLLGVYADLNNYPGSLLAHTAAFATVANSWNKQPVTTQPDLPAGKYWPCYFASSNALAFLKQSNSGAISRFIALTFAGALPTAFPPNAQTTTSNWSLYASLLGGPPPPLTLPAAPSGLTVIPR